jgi:hypothetical protein
LSRDGGDRVSSTRCTIGGSRGLGGAGREIRR